MTFELVKCGPGCAELHRIDCTPKKLYRVNFEPVGEVLELNTLPDDLPAGVQLELVNWFHEIQENGYQGLKEITDEP